jgi:hypothetical protein
MRIKQILSMIACLVVFILVIISASAQPTLHHVSGKVYNIGGGNVPNNIPVRINVTETDNLYKTYTYGPPPSPNNYDYDVTGEDGEVIIVHAWNSTNYGENTTTLVDSPGTTTLHIHLTNARGTEANVTIVAPVNSSSFKQYYTFNVTANITILGDDGTNCEAEISFSNTTVLNVTSGEDLVQSLGSVNKGSWRNVTWNVTAKSAGSSDITITSYCNEDIIALEMLNVKSVSNITVNASTAPNNPDISLVSLDNTISPSGSLNCSAEITDPTGDSMNVTVRWYKDNNHNLTVNYDSNYQNGTVFYALLDARNLSVGDSWNCEMRVFDGSEYSNWVNSSSLSIVRNAIPNISFLAPTPTHAQIWNYSSAMINVSITDLDSSTTYGFIDWRGSLAAWWTMDHFLGTTLYDNSTNSNNGVISGNANQASDGRFNRMFRFGGSSDYINVSHDPSLNAGLDGLSVSTWFRTSASSGWACIIGKGVDPTWMIELDLSGTSCDMGDIVFYDGTTKRCLGGSAGYNDGSWHHVFLTYNISHWNLQADGGVETNTFAKQESLDNSGNLYIGKSPSSNSNYFNGTIDDTMIFNRSLSLIEAKALYNSTQNNLYRNFTDLVGSYQYNAYAVDASGNVNFTSRTFTIDLPPSINSHGTEPEMPVENEVLYIYANVTDDGTIHWVNFTVTAPNGTAVISNQNATWNGGDIWNSSDFNADSIGTWNWSISTYDGTSFATAKGSFILSSWQIIVGNVTGALVLDDSTGSSLLSWNVGDITGSNVYIADSDHTIDFRSLTAFSRNISGSYDGSDFTELDILLNMSDVSDSIDSTFTSSGNPLLTANFTVFGITLTDVPVINSTNSSDFITGILWDSSDDLGDGGYNIDDQEAIVFVTNVNEAKQGEYGIYDYEIRIPANLRKYDMQTTTSVSIYAEIR